ncbi:hypothetical protein AWC38_SpisGene18015 [Stylophora pistillata]|uniref:Uncharacterized protein n=1 Tax=Stylophora pistillata TaxID=50429 RepID=A0A2B4RN36_STYPI|nr:hypothetical protein AWC38_SpisGene18015 [Stylophora pistillata]
MPKRKRLEEEAEDLDWIEGEVPEVSENEGETDSEDTDDNVSVDPVPSTSHAGGKFNNRARSRRPLRARRVPAGRGTGGVQGARAGALVARGSARGVTLKDYIPIFEPSSSDPS